jgi:hypothetical protein
VGSGWDCGSGSITSNLGSLIHVNQPAFISPTALGAKMGNIGRVCIVTFSRTGQVGSSGKYGTARDEYSLKSSTMAVEAEYSDAAVERNTKKSFRVSNMTLSFIVQG